MLTRFEVDEFQGAGGGLPTGTVTFVLGDLVGSTRLWERHAGAMPAVLARLDQIIDGGVASHRGGRPVEQGEGDSFVAVFARAIDGVDFALDLQRALAEDAWPEGVEVQLRVALHTGEARLRDEGRYMGEPLNRCARVRQLGHGRQVLVSSTTAELVVDQLSGGAFLKDLGVQHLRDLTRPERVAQLCAPDLPFEFPALRSLDRLPNNLPVLVTSFVGRGEELAETAALLADRRMVTLTGAGGCGKTRLAIQLGADLLDRYPDGVWLTDLARLADPALVSKAVAGALGVAEVPAQPMVDTVTGHLRDREALLILDNCEHLLDACVELVEPLLRSCPGVRVLATSREPLGAEGEATYRVPSLTLPADAADADCASVQLFADRAALARPQLHLGPDNVAAVTAICSRLDGIPLAIELAAARCRALTPGQIATQLEDRFGFLTGGRRAGLPRQRTLEASVDWSYALLEEEERLLLRRLSVFAAGFTLDSVAAVCGDDSVQSFRFVDLVTSLVDKSLVQPEGDEAAPRYRLLETIRDYARQKLIDAGEVTDARQRHAEYFVSLAEEAWDGIVGAQMLRWERILDAELDNLRVADDWAAETGQADLALRLGGREFWIRRGVGEGSQRLTRALGLPGGVGAPRVRALLAAGECAWMTGDFATMSRLLGEAVQIADELDDRALKGQLLSALGWGEFPQLNENARELLEEGLGFLRSDGPTHWIVDCLWGLGLIGLYTGTAEETRQRFGEALSLARTTGNPMTIARSLVLLALELIFEGDLDDAKVMSAEARPLQAECGDHAFIGLADSALAWVAASRGDTAGSLALSGATLAEARRTQQGFSASWAFWAHLLAEFRGSQPGDPLPSLDDAETSLEAEGIPWGVAWCRSIRAEHQLATGDLASARRAAEAAVELADSTIYAGRARGRARLALARVVRAEGDPAAAEDTAHQALAMVASANMRPEVIETFELLGGLAVEQGSPAEAARLLGAAAAARDELGYPLPPVETPVVERDLDRARAALDPSAFEAAWIEGRAMTLDDAVAYGSRGRGERKRPASGWNSLTPTEQEVVRLVAEGLRNADIAAKLFVSPATVKTHLSHVFAKLGVSTRAELAVLATRRT